MIAYVDSSVLLRHILGQPDPLRGLDEFDSRITSRVAEVECLRGIESVRLRGLFGSEEAADRRRIANAQLRRMRRLAITVSVLRRAGETYPLPVGSLDAIHLASALSLRDRGEPDLVFATHDRQLGRVAAVLDFPVIGL